MENFWKDLQQKKKPFFVLAPMYDVTDTAFRRIIARYSAPDVMVTEFASADGLSHPVGRERLAHLLWYDAEERRGGETKLVAQLFADDPENMRRAAALCAERGFDGVDINMGCPEKNIVKQGAGAGMIQDPERAAAMIAAAKDGAEHVPVSVKTRIGFNAPEYTTWLPVLLEQDIAALTVHLRTRKEMSEVPAHWEIVTEIAEIARRYDTPIIGNGDVASVADGTQKAQTTGADGIMIGRGIFGNPWLFRSEEYTPTVTERLEVLLEHTELYAELFTGVKSFALMKKHFKAYVSGFSDAGALRRELMEAENATEVRDTIAEYLQQRTF